MKILASVNVKQVTANKDTLIQFLYAFHNVVNKSTGVPDFPKEGLAIYNRANTQRVVAHFNRIMTTNMNNEKLMMDAFRRQKYMTAFQTYIKTNGYKYNA
jgi:UDP-glucose 6-dehydrogenase